MAIHALLKPAIHSWIPSSLHQRLPVSESPVIGLPIRRNLKKSSTLFPLIPLRGSSVGCPSKFTRFDRHVLNAKEEDQDPSSPEPEHLFENDKSDITGIEASLYKVQDGVQIFFAVLFWMSLFFWASAWDGRNNGRPNKGWPFRR